MPPNFFKEKQEYELYKNDVTEAICLYESYFREVDPQFSFQGDLFLESNLFYVEGYENAWKKTLEKLHREIEIRGKDIIQSHQHESNQLEEELKTLKIELADILGETKRVESSSKDIKNALSIQGPNLDESNADTYQCFYDLKSTVTDFLGKRGLNREQNLRNIIQEMLTVTRYTAVESDLQEIETLLVQSGHRKWIKQLRLHVVKCYLDRETSTELVDEYISRLNQEIQSSDLDKVYCLRKADQLSKYALAAELYYDGDYSYEKADELYGKRCGEIEITVGDVVDSNTEVPQPSTMDTKRENAEESDILKLINGGLHRSPAVIQQNTGDADVEDSLPLIERFTLAEWSTHMNEGKLCKTCTWCVHKEICSIKKKDCTRCIQLKNHKKNCLKHKAQCALCLAAALNKRPRSLHISP
ncbi:unnamed protein product [Mucor hiemalis]